MPFTSGSLDAILADADESDDNFLDSVALPNSYQEVRQPFQNYAFSYITFETFRICWRRCAVFLQIEGLRPFIGMRAWKRRSREAVLSKGICPTRICSEEAVDEDEELA